MNARTQQAVVRIGLAASMVLLAFGLGSVTARHNASAPRVLPADRVGALLQEVQDRTLTMYLHRRHDGLLRADYYVTLASPSVEGASVESKAQGDSLAGVLDEALGPHRRCRLQCEAPK